MLAAAVSHKPTESSGWTITSFSVPQGGYSPYIQAEMAGIAGALAIAISSVTSLRREGSGSLQRIVVLTDCQAAIVKLQKLQEHTMEHLRVYDLACKLITRSRYLQHLGVSVEIRWVPSHHTSIPRNILVGAEAQRAARTSIDVSEEEMIQFTCDTD